MRRRVGRDWIDLGPASARDWYTTSPEVCERGHVLDEVGVTPRTEGRNPRCAECNRENVARHRRRRRASMDVIPAL